MGRKEAAVTWVKVFHPPPMLLCLLKIHLVGATNKFVIFPRIVCDSFGLGEDK